MATECPRAARHCPRCRGETGFVCSERFRVNAHQRRVDVWLVYRCGVCSATWKATIFERRTPKEIGVELYQRFQNNDRELAWRYAFDGEWLRRLGVRVDDRVPFRIERGAAEASSAHLIRFEFGYPFRIRLDRLLAHALGESRSQIAKRWKRGLIVSDNGAALRQPARDGETLRIVGEAGVCGTHKVMAAVQ